jgi:hypothetical protein
MSYRTLPIVALSLAALIAGPTLAVAGSCKDTKRTGNPGDISAGSAKTTVKNEMSDDTVLVEITRNGTEKLHESIKPGQSTGFKAGLGGHAGAATLEVQLYPEQGTKGESCVYVANQRGPNNYEQMVVTWKLPDGESEVCPNLTTIKVSCDKSFHKGSLQYHTVFTIKDR